jgi:hypothetical protein
MSRNIDNDAAFAFHGRKRFFRCNTKVETNDDTGETTMYLHGSKIAIIHFNGDIEVSLCGYNTKTTRSRLSAIPGIVVRSRKGNIYLNNQPWDGKRIKIINL